MAGATSSGSLPASTVVFGGYTFGRIAPAVSRGHSGQAIWTPQGYSGFVPLSESNNVLEYAKVGPAERASEQSPDSSQYSDKRYHAPPHMTVYQQEYTLRPNDFRQALHVNSKPGGSSLSLAKSAAFPEGGAGSEQPKQTQSFVQKVLRRTSPGSPFYRGGFLEKQQ
eukprot:tig00001029_g6422.t1